MSGWSDIPGAGRANLVEALSVARDLPAEALERAVREPARIAPDVLRVVERAANGESLTDRETNLLFWGIHVLAAARDTRLAAPLLRLLRRPLEEVANVMGDAVASTLPRIVASVFDGDVDALEAAITDREADEFVRWSLLGALAFLTVQDRIARERTRALLVAFDTDRPARAGDAAWNGWEQAVALLGFADMADRVDAARTEARLLDDTSDPTWFAATLTEAEAHPNDLTRFRELELGLIQDVVEELEEALETEDEPEPEAPVTNPLRHVGRNDPCPCGSGRKFKQCCLSTAPSR